MSALYSPVFHKYPGLTLINNPGFYLATPSHGWNGDSTAFRGREKMNGGWNEALRKDWLLNDTGAGNKGTFIAATTSQRREPGGKKQWQRSALFEFTKKAQWVCAGLDPKQNTSFVTHKRHAQTHTQHTHHTESMPQPAKYIKLKVTK